MLVVDECDWRNSCGRETLPALLFSLCQCSQSMPGMPWGAIQLPHQMHSLARPELPVAGLVAVVPHSCKTHTCRSPLDQMPHCLCCYECKSQTVVQTTVDYTEGMHSIEGKQHRIYVVPPPPVQCTWCTYFANDPTRLMLSDGGCGTYLVHQVGAPCTWIFPRLPLYFEIKWCGLLLCWHGACYINNFTSTAWYCECKLMYACSKSTGETHVPEPYLPMLCLLSSWWNCVCLCNSDISICGACLLGD